MITLEERAALRVLANAAAPGPWQVRGAVVYAGDWGSIESDMMIYDEGGHTESDARYIAAACNAVPALLDMLDAAETELAQRWQDGYAAALRDTAALRRRAEDTEKALDRVRGLRVYSDDPDGRGRAYVYEDDLRAAIDRTEE